ncbi:MAG: hypothetical protein R3B09_18385 [Nannocystaceae bacterium]
MRRGAITGAFTIAGLVAAAGLAACGQPCAERPGDVCLVMGTGDFGFNRDGLAPAETDLYLPSCARRGPDGRVYVMDFNNQRLRVIGDDGRVETLIGDGFHAIASTGVPVLETPLENPIDFAFLGDGRLVFVSYHDPRVLAVTPEGTLMTLAGQPDGVVGMIGDEGDGGPPEGALFLQLDGIAVGPGDVLYVSDSLANRVRKIEGGIIDTVAGTGEATFAGDGGPAREAGLHWPTAIELTPTGELLIADTFNHAVRRLEVDGTLTTLAGTGVEGHEGDGGPASAAALRQPYGLALDDDGSIYVADRGNYRIRRIDAEGVIDTVAGTGEEGPSGDDGPGSAAKFGAVARIALDGDGLLIADQGGSTIRRLNLR